jgi:K+-sensing histidine kinase KdpD
VRGLLQTRIAGYAASIAGVLIVAFLFWPFYRDVRGITAATALLIVVLLVAIRWGMGPALVSSLLGTAYLNFFFVPPTLTLQFRMAEGDDLVSMVAFLVTSILVGQLSSRAQRHARKNQELYEELRAAFDQASKLEAVKQSERLKSALLDSVTHDLRTPLTSIKASATALIDVRTNDSKAPARINGPEDDLLKNILQQTDRLNHFIEGMIELAQIEAGREQGTQKWEAIPMEDIIGIAVSRAEDALKNHEVIVACEENLITDVNPRAVSEVLFSLLENAGRYAPSATRVWVIVKLADSTAIQIAVEDEGPGVPAHLHHRVFDKFFRSSGVEKRSSLATGLGLGLAIARGIVEAHGGRIWVENRGPDKQGARFVFTVAAASASRLDQTETERTVSK